MLGKFGLWNDGYTHLSFKHRRCAQCDYPLARETLIIAYWSTVCNEKLCQMCAEMIPFDPVPRMRGLVFSQSNLNQWCHKAQDSEKWKTPAKEGCVSTRSGEWTWERMEAANVDASAYVFNTQRSHRSSQQGHAILRAKRSHPRANAPLPKVRMVNRGKHHAIQVVQRARQGARRAST